MSKDHIEKGMFLRGGDYPARIVHTPARQYPDDPPPLDEIKSRLQRVQEALDFIRESTKLGKSG